MIENMSVLICENSFASMETISSALVKVGFSKNKIYQTRIFKEALEHIETDRPDFLITEYFVDGRCGLELIPPLIDQKANNIIMLVTTNNSTAAIAEAAEELVDDYIIKPILTSNLEERIRNLVKRKLSPPQYIAEILKGKQFLLDNEFEAANRQFKNASQLDPKPTLAYYYLGHTSFLQRNFSAAITEYQEGLNYRPLHFKCLTGQFDAYFEQRQFQEAYDMVPQLTQHYPISARRLCNLFVAAVYSGRMEEVPRYYELFTKLHHVTPELRKTFSAALYVAGLYHMNRNDLEKALSCFDCGLTVIGSDQHYIDKVVRILTSAGAQTAQHAGKFLKKFPSKLTGGKEHSILVYLVDQYKNTAAMRIEQGRYLAQNNFADPECFRILIRTLLLENKTTLAEDYINRAITLFPDLRAEFLQMESDL